MIKHATREQAEAFEKFCKLYGFNYRDLNYPNVSYIHKIRKEANLRIGQSGDSISYYSLEGWGLYEYPDCGFYFEGLGYVPIDQWVEKLSINPKIVVKEEKDFYTWLAGDRR